MCEELVTVGKVNKLHGRDGELKVRILSEYPERFAIGAVFFFKKAEETKTYCVKKCHIKGEFAIIKLENVDTAALAQELLGSEICIKEDSLMPLSQDRYYIHSLEGCKVFDEDKNYVGILKEVWKLPANDVFVVANGTKEVLFPAVKHAIKNISITQGEIIVDSHFGVL